MDDVERWIEQLAHPDFRVRQEATWLLGLSGDPRAVDALVSALNDADAGVCQQAASGLGRLGEARAVLPLLSVLRLRDDALRCAAGTALYGLGDHHAAARVYHGDVRAVKALLNIIKNEEAVMKALASATGDVFRESSLWRSSKGRFPLFNPANSAGGTADEARTPDHQTPPASVLYPVLTCEELAAPALAAAEALGRIAARNPARGLREALPLLRALGHYTLNVDQRQVYWTALRAIERAVKAFEDLPLPASAPRASVESLPLPAVTGAPDPELLPIPVDATAGRQSSPGRPPLLRRLRRWFRRDG